MLSFEAFENTWYYQHNILYKTDTLPKAIVNYSVLDISN